MPTNSTFPYRLAAIDLDDTLLSPDKTISEANIAAIQALRSLGVRILLASGRRHENMVRYHRMLELEGPIVSCQGALARNAETGEILHQQCMSSELAIRVVNDGEARGITQVYYHLDGTYVTELNAWTDLYGSRTGTPVSTIDSLHTFDGTEPLKVLWVGEPDYFIQRFDEIHSEYGNHLEMVVTDPEYLEFMAAGVTKSLGIAAVAARYGIAQSEVLAFGDGNNDVTMLRWSGLGIAMDHGRAAAKEASDLIAPDGAPESSFARAVELVLNR